MNKNLIITAILITAGFAGGIFIWSLSNTEQPDTKVDSTNSEQPSKVQETVQSAPTSLPLGDGKVSTSAKQGYIYSCVTRFGGGGAFKDGDWIQGDSWFPEGKDVVVDGAVEWDNTHLLYTFKDKMRTIESNGIPTHISGVFPVQKDDDAYDYDRNPNTISEQAFSFTVPMTPTIAKSPTCLDLGMIGITLTGVPLFNGLDALGRDAAAHEIQDICDGHPERSGSYHYHNYSDCLAEKANITGLVGYARDGFGIYSNIEDGKRLSNIDLDECHGHSHSIKWDNQEQEIYHYHMTDEYPYSLGCYRGTVN